MNNALNKILSVGVLAVVMGLVGCKGGGQNSEVQDVAPRNCNPQNEYVTCNLEESSLVERDLSSKLLEISSLMEGAVALECKSNPLTVGCEAYLPSSNPTSTAPSINPSAPSINALLSSANSIGGSGFGLVARLGLGGSTDPDIFNTTSAAADQSVPANEIAVSPSTDATSPNQLSSQGCSEVAFTSCFPPALRELTALFTKRLEWVRARITVLTENAAPTFQCRIP